MSMEIILAAVIVGGTGLLLGLFLGLAGKKFAVEIDEKEQQVREQLPGNKDVMRWQRRLQTERLR